MSALADPPEPSRSLVETGGERLSGRVLAMLPLMTGAALAVGGVAAADEGTRLNERTEIKSVAALLGGAADVDDGTRVAVRYDYRPMIEGTSLARVIVEGPIQPFHRPTRMARLRAVAPLSLRDWAYVLDVSHSAVGQWVENEPPERRNLDRILDALTEARAHHSDVASWLAARLPGMGVRPMDLLREERWRAFRGAMRARSAPSVTLSPDELMHRRREQASWVVAEPATVADEA